MAGFSFLELRNAVYVFFYGVGLSVVYDIIRIFRRIVRHNTVAISVEDLLFWFATSIATLFFLIDINDGGIRAYFIVGMFFGAYIYRLTLGRCIMKSVMKWREKRAKRREKI